MKGSPRPWRERKDEELMLAYQEGQSAAFDELYRRYSGRVYGYLRGRLSDRAVLDDVFQGTFLKLHRSRSQYNATFPFAPWLFTICRTQMLDVLRERSRRPEDATDRVEELPEVAQAMPAEAPALSLDLSSLPERHRQAIQLRYLEGLGFEEIARRLETSPANIRQIVSRATQRLKVLYAGNKGRGHE